MAAKIDGAVSMLVSQCSYLNEWGNIPYRDSKLRLMSRKFSDRISMMKPDFCFSFNISLDSKFIRDLIENNFRKFKLT
jgi:hypothetical protein